MSEEPQLAEREDLGVELAPGTVISQSKQYQIVQRLGEGGMGKVYKVFDPIMNRYAALKMIKINVPDDYKRRFRQEARLCGTFMHPNLCRTLEVGTTKEHGLFWFAMEYLEGRDLSQLLESGRAPSLRPLQEVFKQTLEGLQHVHARKFVHCDIKPANIFIATDLYDPGLKLVKLLDFGIARDLSDTTPPDKKRIYGDPFYMPPEQTIPGNVFDQRADLYALGMTFFEMVTGGRHPFEDLQDEHPRELLKAHREREPVPPSYFMSKELPANRLADIDAFVMAACAKDPEHRFQNAKAMQRALMAIDPG